ncbi:HNH endonuclease [Streptomyces sp. NRRL F-4489]|uniref:HNH endonuclease n=1 Tax=Streptomyces sp. NRRL F-4489 TaxID=1609095 RepID=UPI003B63A1A9
MDGRKRPAAQPLRRKGKSKVIPGEEFWSRVHKTDGCWIWTGGNRGNGYGTFWAQGKRYYAHRYAYYLASGKMPEGIILHACDNTICVRPDHLSEGTQADNVIDMWHKGRGVPPPRHVGESHPYAKLTEETVRQIRQQYDSGHYTQSELARAHGIGRTAVGCVVRHETWRHVGDPQTTKAAA